MDESLLDDGYGDEYDDGADDGAEDEVDGLEEEEEYADDFGTSSVKQTTTAGSYSADWDNTEEAARPKERVEPAKKAEEPERKPPKTAEPPKTEEPPPKREASPPKTEAPPKREAPNQPQKTQAPNQPTKTEPAKPSEPACEEVDKTQYVEARQARDEMARKASRRNSRETSTAEAKEELYRASTKLVAEAEKNAMLSKKLLSVREELDRLKEDAGKTRAVLIEKLVGGGSRRKADGDAAYKHVNLFQLVGLREKAFEAALSASSSSSSSCVETGSQQQQRPSTSPETGGDATTTTTRTLDDADPAAPLEKTVRDLETELAKLRAKLAKSDEDKQHLRLELRSALCATDDVRALKHKITDVLQRGKVEKDLRAKAEDEAKVAARKVVALSDHVEKLMVHLKHEVSAKVGVQDQLRRAEKEVDRVKQRNAVLLKRNNAREKFLLELKEGSKILEDQLRLMDRRYLELRSKLDWTRHHADREVRKAKHTASTLRAKWALATNSQSGLLDTVDLAPLQHKKPQTPTSPATVPEQAHDPAPGGHVQRYGGPGGPVIRY